MLLISLGCANRQTIHTGTFDNETYELKSVETQGFSTNSISYELTLGRWKSAKIDAITTDWGAPYADDLYGNARRVYIRPDHIAYRNEPDNAVDHQATMLYLSPSRFSPDAFARYADFMKAAWPGIDRQFATDRYNRFPHIIGIVYGKQRDFARTFRGRHEGKAYLIRVEPDGRIRYMLDSQGANDEYSGLSEKVHMPGKIVYLATGKDARLTLAQVRTYTDETDKALTDYFELREKP